MSFIICIDNAVETGKLSENKGKQAKKAFETAYEKALAEGLDEGSAVAKASDVSVKSISGGVKAKRWSKINEMQRAWELAERINNSKEPGRELDAIMRDLENMQNSVLGIALANQTELLIRYKPKLAGLKIPTKGLDQVVRGSYKESVHPDYKNMADSMEETEELLRNWANMYGANIPKNPNYRLSQSLDQVYVNAVNEQEFIKDMKEHVDYDVMRYAGKLINPDEADEVFSASYKGIVSDGMNRTKAGQAELNLINRLNRERFFYYKDADSWLFMQKKYGSGNVFEQFIGHVDAASRDIALLKVFGPNPHSMKEYAKRIATKRGADLDLAGAKGVRKKAVHASESFERQYLIFSRHVPSADGNVPVQVFTSVRTFAVSNLLGPILIPSIYGDLANAKAMKNLYNLPYTSTVRNYFANFVPTKANITNTVESGIIYQAGLSWTLNRIRYFGSMDGNAFVRRWADIVFRSTVTSHHTQVQRGAEGKQLLNIWARFADNKFDDTPFGPTFTEMGISPEDWDLFRRTKISTGSGIRMLRPIDLWASDDVNDKKVAEKFSMFLQAYIRKMVPEPDLRTRAALGEASDPNTVMGQLQRTVTSLLAFPAAILFNQLASIRFSANPKTLLAKYMLWMTLGGAFIIQTRAVGIRGEQPEDMTNPLFWGKAFVAGGSLGLAGDLVFNNIDMNNSQYFRGTPTEEWFKRAHKLTLDNAIDFGANVISGEDREIAFGSDLLRFIDTSFPNFWQTQLLLERAFLDELDRQADPVAYSRAVRREQELEQGMWWGTGEDPEPIRLETAVGE